jgi:hypothetical protein
LTLKIARKVWNNYVMDHIYNFTLILQLNEYSKEFKDQDLFKNRQRIEHPIHFITEFQNMLKK